MHCVFFTDLYEEVSGDFTQCTSVINIFFFNLVCLHLILCFYVCAFYNLIHSTNFNNGYICACACASACACECALAGAGECVLSFVSVALLVYFIVHLPRV